MQEDIKIILKEQTEEIKREVSQKVGEEVKRHIDVIREDFDSKVSLIAEQYESIRKTLDSNSEMIAANSVTLTAVKADIEIMKVDVGFIKNSLKKKVDIEEFEVLENRVALLEAKARS